MDIQEGKDDVVSLGTGKREQIKERCRWRDGMPRCGGGVRHADTRLAGRWHRSLGVGKQYGSKDRCAGEGEVNVRV